MLSVKILGAGCSKCKTLEAKVRNIVTNNNIQAENNKSGKYKRNDELRNYDDTGSGCRW